MNSVLNIFQSADLVIYPLGGCGEFGMNNTLIHAEGFTIMVDCGIMFSEATKLGTDALIPNPDAVLASIGGVDAYVITHGHEDHIGALPIFFERHPAPVYATEWTARLIARRCERYGFDMGEALNLVSPGDTIKIGSMTITYLPVNHSIPMACALRISTSKVSLVHTGDFKFDPASQFEAPVTAKAFAKSKIGKTDLLLVDSTNASRDGPTPAEAEVLESLRTLVSTTKRCLYVTTFSSNLWRLINVINVCYAGGRKVHLAGGSIEQTVQLGIDLGLYNPPDGAIASYEEVDAIPSHKLVVLLTGCQAEPRAALTRISFEEHRRFKLSPGDRVAFSSRIIPGNERPILNIMDQILRQGAEVVTTREDPGIHVSGHAYGQDIIDLVNEVEPRYFVPVHGTIQHQRLNAACSQRGVKTPEIHIPTSGDVLVMRDGKLSRESAVEREILYIDSESRRLISLETLRERLRIGYNGLAIVSGVFEAKGARWLRTPEIKMQGIAFEEQEAWCKKASREIVDATAKLSHSFALDEDILNEEARITLRRALTNKLNKKPVVISMIQSV